MDRLYWDVNIKDSEGLAHFIDATASFLRIYLGDVREAVTHAESISRYERVIYNESAWDTQKFQEIRDDLTRPDHHEVIKEVVHRVEKNKCRKVDLGYVGRWKNPYQIADTHLPTGITMSYEAGEESIRMLTTFFAPDSWFNLQCKPLFKTDPIVEKDPKGSWNMNPVGLIAPKADKAMGNRRAVFNLIVDFIRDFLPDFSALTYVPVYYNSETNLAYLVDPKAKEDEDLHPLMVFFNQPDGKLLYSDSTDLDNKDYKTMPVENGRLMFDKKHFDFA